MGIGNALYNGLSGLNCYSAGISVVSDNVANANTTGFKSNSIRFGDLVNSEYALRTNDSEGEGSGSMVLGIVTDFSQGILMDTSSWSDMAISGKGFFIVKKPSADGEGRTFYTRDGTFHLDKDGYLVTQQGYRVQGYAAGEDGAPGGELSDIQITDPEDSKYIKFYVTTDGVITGIDTDGAEHALSMVGLAGFSNENGLVRNGGNLYTAGPEINLENIIYNGGDNATPEYFGEVMNSSIEGSNVDIAAEMVSMIIYQAGYNANSKSITTSSELLNTSINMIR